MSTLRQRLWITGIQFGINIKIATQKAQAEQQKKMLEAIDFEVKDGKIYVPYFRNDIEHKADVAEEIAKQNILNVIKQFDSVGLIEK